MNTLTFIHSSDLQLGMTRKFLDSDAQSRFDDSRLRAVERLGMLADERGAEFIVIAGDVFEHNSLDPRTIGRAVELLSRLPVPVYLLPGNHDPLIADSIFNRTRDIDNVTVIEESSVIEVRPGVELIGAPLIAKHASEDLVAVALRDLEPSDALRVLVGHGQVASFSSEPAPGLIDLDNIESRIADGTIDYVALGDTHSTQSLGTSGRVWFSGSPEVTDFHDFVPGSAGGEVDSGNALVVTLSGDDIDVEKVHTGQWRFEALSWEVSDLDDVRALLADLDTYEDKARTVIKYSISGTLGLEATRMLEAGIAKQEPVFGALYERDRLWDLHLEPSDEEMANLPLQGFARSAMGELVTSASNNDPTARDAVNLLFRLSQEA
ncbi:exonuclease SbcCD subunit D [Corynebacterium breve]|uniref:Nuclease SbcCD subunit D n=1 Tax=Corynebacterium breve TaxID=3049799 RepID=A0ABY8VJ05_9CORY|nr:exonuclease SbcCD subunit D [Corynebacterium breve]WIM68603.1 exonuclease SbcCD subunit D [Corynebacterium breve]